VLIEGNATLTDLAEGEHNVTIFARDNAGNVGASETITFNISNEPETLPTTWVATGAISTVVVGAGLLAYFRKRSRS
jgi:hypothetical protein